MQVMFPQITGFIEHIRTGKLRALAVTAAMRAEALPDIPAVGEFVPGYAASIWIGIGSPKNTPFEIINKLSQEINTGVADAGMKLRFAEHGDTVCSSLPTEFAKLIAEDTEKWGKVIRAANIKAE